MIDFSRIKICFKCGKPKDIDAFYRHKKMADGHLGKCKECTKRDVTTHRDENLEKIRAYDRRRGCRHPPGYLKRWRADNLGKYQAQNAANNALRDGKIVRARQCSRCPSTFALHKHHPDYNEPLKVEWLCAACHRREETNGHGQGQL